MGKFTPYLNDHFGSLGCRLIARAFDKCRERRVSIFAIPGQSDAVGVSDGTDAWIAPATAGLFFGTSTGDCADLMRRLAAGEELPPVPDWPEKRQRVPLKEREEEEPALKPRRARVEMESQPQQRSRRAFI